MKISEVVRGKGDGVVTIAPEASVGELLGLLAEHRIGAVVVSRDGSGVHGIVSERDVVRHLHSTGPAIIDGPVSAIMTADVRTADLDTDLDALEGAMTEHRIRHVPIVADGRLIAIVSIGDVVKSTITQLKFERDRLQEYVST